MSKITSIENHKDKDNHYGSFIIEPLDIGQGITLGNALRRTLLSDISGFAITGVRINNIKHEFASITGLREDIAEVILNLKEIVFKPAFIYKDYLTSTKTRAFLHIKGPIIVTAGMFNLPKGIVTIVNPEQYIGTLVTPSELYIEVDIEKGKGYRLTEENRRQLPLENVLPIKPSTLSIDSLFTPIKKVNYKIKLIHDTNGVIKESLHLQISTNGSITPKRSLQEALKLLIHLFAQLFIDKDFLTISSQLSTKFYKNYKK